MSMIRSAFAQPVRARRDDGARGVPLHGTNRGPPSYVCTLAVTSGGRNSCLEPRHCHPPSARTDVEHDSHRGRPAVVPGPCGRQPLRRARLVCSRAIGRSAVRGRAGPGQALGRCPGVPGGRARRAAKPGTPDRSRRPGSPRTAGVTGCTWRDDQAPGILTAPRRALMVLVGAERALGYYPLTVAPLPAPPDAARRGSPSMAHAVSLVTVRGDDDANLANCARTARVAADAVRLPSPLGNRRIPG